MGRPEDQPRFLKVETPVTSDGINLAYDNQQRPLFKTTFLPLTARKELERNAAKLPKHLKPTITVMSNEKN
jgi:hypothetical protein